MASNDSSSALVEPLSLGIAGEDIVASVLDSIPCGVLILDRRRRIRHVNEAFRRALGITDSTCIGSCQGSVLGCLHAVDEHSRHASSAVCEECELAGIATRAFEEGNKIRGTATLQLARDGRLLDVTLTTTALPVTVSGEEFAIVLIESMSELVELRPVESDGTTFGMVGRDPAMHELYDLIREVGPLQVPVLILGALLPVLPLRRIWRSSATNLR